MKTLILAAIRCSLPFLLPTLTYATSAQWDLDPMSGDWNTAANWTPNGVPNGPSDTATFDLSNTTDVSISEDTEVNGITFTSAATNPYTITASPSVTLTISGTGVTNNSGIIQHFATAVDDASGTSGTMVFSNSATAGRNVSIFNPGTINFLNTSTAGGASITIGFSPSFVSVLQFANNSTAANSFIDSAFFSTVRFGDNSTAGSAFMRVGDGTFLQFGGTSTAGSASIFAWNSLISFEGSSRGGTAQIELADFGGPGGVPLARYNRS
jgi:hypothetical protein